MERGCCCCSNSIGDLMGNWPTISDWTEAGGDLILNEEINAVEFNNKTKPIFQALNSPSVGIPDSGAGERVGITAAEVQTDGLSQDKIEGVGLAHLVGLNFQTATANTKVANSISLKKGLGEVFSTEYIFKGTFAAGDSGDTFDITVDGVAATAVDMDGTGGTIADWATALQTNINTALSGPTVEVEHDNINITLSSNFQILIFANVNADITTKTGIVAGTVHPDVSAAGVGYLILRPTVLLDLQRITGGIEGQVLYVTKDPNVSMEHTMAYRASVGTKDGDLIFRAAAQVVLPRYNWIKFIYMDDNKDGIGTWWEVCHLYDGANGEG